MTMHFTGAAGPIFRHRTVRDALAEVAQRHMTTMVLSYDESERVLGGDVATIDRVTLRAEERAESAGRPCTVKTCVAGQTPRVWREVGRGE